VNSDCPSPTEVVGYACGRRNDLHKHMLTCSDCAGQALAAVLLRQASGFGFLSEERLQELQDSLERDKDEH